MNKGLSYYYRILGLQFGASPTEIKAAYRKLVKLYHPDMCKSADSMAMYKEIRTAYDMLSNWDYSSVTDINTATRTTTNAGTYAKTATKTGTGTKANTGTASSRVSSRSKLIDEEFDRLFNEEYYKQQSIGKKFINYFALTMFILLALIEIIAIVKYFFP